MPNLVKIGYDQKIVDIIYEYGKDIIESESFQLEKKHIQHGTTTTYAHSLCVTYMSVWMALKSKKEISMRSVVRGALLHDYFLYDWHEKSMANMIHGFTHPHKAFLQAKKDFELSHVESDMIRHHMFPLTPMPPKTKEGIILCIADKICATKETVMGRFPWRT